MKKIYGDIFIGQFIDGKRNGQGTSYSTKWNSIWWILERWFSL